MTAKAVAIIPKRKFSQAGAQEVIDAYLRAFAQEFQDEMATYPPALPWRSRTPRSGPRQGGRRTGAYGQGWRSQPRFSRASVTIQNNVYYASAVGGPNRRSPGQARWLADRGWRSISDVGPAVVRRHLPDFSKKIFTSA